VGKGGRFNPSFPATCPYITAVGATQINPNSTVYEPESACEQFAHSGGGFSNIFPMPFYQEAAVKGYLKNHPPPYTAEQYNNSGMVERFAFHCEPASAIHADASARSAHIQICLPMGHFYFATIP
jgi:subtilase family serine protease